MDDNNKQDNSNDNEDWNKPNTSSKLNQQEESNKKEDEDDDESYFKITISNSPTFRINKITKIDKFSPSNNKAENDNDSDIAEHESKRPRSDSNLESSSNEASKLSPNSSTLLKKSRTENVDIELDSDSDVDLSSVKLYKPLTSSASADGNKTDVKKVSSSTKRKRDETAPSTSSSQTENNAETTNQQDENSNDSRRTLKTKSNPKLASIKEASNVESLYNTKSEDYWKKVYDSSNFSSKAFCISDIMNRELGWSGRTGHGTCNNLFSFNNNRGQNSASLLYDQTVQTPRHFIRRAMSSMSLARRMKLAQNLNYHEGCVNALNFNRIGTLLASGSDDYQVCLWDWTRNNLVLTFDSGHKSNVFQTKFIPFTGDSQIVTCARDGQIRLALISSSGAHIGTKKLAKHADSCHKLSIEYDSSNLFLSCGEDGQVFEIDLRQQSPAKILNVKHVDRNYKLPLYSIASNPSNYYQFVVAGKDQYIRIYDKRMLVEDRTKILKKMCPLNLKDLQRASITSAVYNYNGTEIIASFSDDDIYLFETDQDEDKDAKFRFKGHRNTETIKGVNFYGANSEYVVSGSDCGQIFFWDKTSQQIVNVVKGDEHGIVNVLEPHPNYPILATSGLDSDVKIWCPLSEQINSLDNLVDIIKDNQRFRDNNRHFSLSSFEFELLLLLMHRPNNRVFFRSRDGDMTALSQSGNDNNTNNDTHNETSASNENSNDAPSQFMNFYNEENDDDDDDDEEDEEDDEEEDEDEDDVDEPEDDDDDDDENDDLDINFFENENTTDLSDASNLFSFNDSAILNRESPEYSIVSSESNLTNINSNQAEVNGKLSTISENQTLSNGFDSNDSNDSSLLYSNRNASIIKNSSDRINSECVSSLDNEYDMSLSDISSIPNSNRQDE